MADETNNPKLPLEGGGGPPSNVLPINIEEEMRRSYLDYSMSVIIGRALPDIRDGLKPVHRRILYAMHDMGLLHSRKTVKCAKIVGEVLGKYHPHGDSSVYDATVRMAQNFSLRYPLVDGQGNFGSVDGDPPAAYRYTEARLTALAAELLADIDKDTVDFVANFDDSTAEPTVLPSKIPTLLVNGSNGIAVGMATNIPPHNLTEILTAAILLVEKPHTQLEEILTIVQGPDFPTAGFIHGRKGIHEAYRTGRGRFLMRAKVAIEHMTKERDAIVVTEIPYQVNKARMIERIADLVNEKIIEEISDIRDESDRDGMRIPATRDGTGAGAPVLRRSSRGCDSQAHGIPAAEGKGSRPHPGGIPEGSGLPGSCDCDHSRQPEPGGSSRESGGVLRREEDHDQPDGTDAGD